MPSSNPANSNPVGTPRIQISLKKDQRKSMMLAASASVTPMSRGSSERKTERNRNNNSEPTTNANENANANAKKQTIHSTIAANPGLYKSVRKALKNQTLNFKINVECTSLKLSPSGNFLWGGFSDGTLRVWDLSGTFGVENDDVVASRQKTDVLVNSKLSQGYGAVACQIHARGVHTDLITTVDISDDAQYVFVGVARGAMELHAVFVGDLERAVHTHKLREHNHNNVNIKRNILDYLKVYCHSDAKLKGFGACATMRVASRSAAEQPQHNQINVNPSSSSPSSYMLLTGKGIKNIHIWKFTPPEHPNNNNEMEDYNDDDELHGNGNGNGRNRNRNQSICEPPDDDEDHGTWDQCYDTSTNGNTIVLLGFYRNPQNKLLAVSKSDAQKLRLWDLSFEEEDVVDEDNDIDIDIESRRPKRPPYKDVANSQFALEVAGGIGVCGGGNMYNEMSIVSLDKPDDPFNHTELALPKAQALGAPGDVAVVSFRRQRRGEMKAVVNVATSPRDSSHALLELDDGSLVGYSAGSSSSSSTSSSSKDSSSGSIPRLAIATPESTGIPALPADFWRRCICLANIAGVVIAASSLYNPNTNKGQLVIRALGGLKKPRGSEAKEKKKLKLLLKQQQKQKEREKLELKREQKMEREREMLLLKQQQREQREKQDRQQRQQAMAPPKTPSPLHTNLESSPVAADTQALRDAVSAPTTVPVSALRTNSKNSLDTTKGGRKEKFEMSNTNTVASTQSSSSASASLTHVSPNGSMETPSHQKNNTSSSNEQDDSPDSTQGLPKISQFLQPKRINMQSQQLQEKSKKRKPHQQQSIETETAKTETKVVKKARKALETSQATKKSTEKVASNSPVAIFQLNSIGSVTFKSPQPHTKKLMKVGAPSKPKKPTNPTSLSSTSFSTPVSKKPLEKPIVKLVSGAGERKRDRPAVESVVAAVASKKIARTSDDVSTALLLTALASPKPAAKGKPKPADNTVGVTPKTTAKAAATVTPKVTAAVAGQSKATVKTLSKPKSKGKSSTHSSAASTAPQQPSREEILHEKISEQYKQLRTSLKGITDSSMALIHSRNLRGPVPSALASKSDRTHLSAYSKLLGEHRAAHVYLQRRLLLSAETTLRLLLESRITAEEARTELKQSIKKFEEILYDTLHRQEMERLAVVAQHHGTPSNFVKGRSLTSIPELTKEQSNYPCKEAFDKVEDICAAITRPVGRPRSALAALR